MTDQDRKIFEMCNAIDKFAEMAKIYCLEVRNIDDPFGAKMIVNNEYYDIKVSKVRKQRKWWRINEILGS